MSDRVENLIEDMHENPAYWAEKYLELKTQLAEAREVLEHVRDWARTTSPELLADIASKALADRKVSDEF